MMKPEVKQTGSFYIMNQDNEYVKLCDIDEKPKIRTVKTSGKNRVVDYMRRRRFLKMFRKPCEFEIEVEGIRADGSDLSDDDD